MSETREFRVIRARVPGGNPCAVYLIDAEDLLEFGNNIAGYFPPRTRDVTEIGRSAATPRCSDTAPTAGPSDSQRATPASGSRR